MTKVKHVIKIILIFSLIMCWALSLGYMSQLKGNSKTVTFYMEDNRVNVATINNLKQSKPDVDVVGWVEEEGQAVYNSDLNRKVNKLRVLSLKGRSSLLLNKSVLFQDDYEGCLVDENTAYKLFGSLNAIGRKISYGTRELVIRGIHNDSKANIIVQMLDDSSTPLTGITVDTTNLSLMELNEYKTMGSIKEYTIENDLYYGIGLIAALSFPVLAMVLYLVKVISGAIKVKKKPIFILIYIFIGFISFMVFLKVTAIKLNIPLDMIPNKWSDFDFWSKMWNEYKEKYEYILYMKKFGVDIYKIQNLLMTVFYSIVTIGLFIINIKVIKIKDMKSLFFHSLIMIISSFIVILIVYSKKNFDVNMTMIWYVYPLYYLGIRMVSSLELVNNN